MIRARSLGALLGTLAALAMFACGTGDLVVGDDARFDASPPEGGSAPDATTPDEKDGSVEDSAADAPVVACSAAPGGPGTCLPTGSACSKADTSLTCPSAGTFCCTSSCPVLSPPAPGFCDGGPTATKYTANGCVAGFACAPIACTSAGGTCVGVAPGSCTTGNVGDAAKYSCGGGLGVMCCLP